MWGLLEGCIIVCCFVFGCRRLTSAKWFMATLGVFLLVFSLVEGNPVILLVSFPGWMFLDAALVTAGVIANAMLVRANRFSGR
jgi:hypothetical protein